MGMRDVASGSRFVLSLSPVSLRNARANRKGLITLVYHPRAETFFSLERPEAVDCYSWRGETDKLFLRQCMGIPVVGARSLFEKDLEV